MCSHAQHIADRELPRQCGFEPQVLGFHDMLGSGYSGFYLAGDEMNLTMIDVIRIGASRREIPKSCEHCGEDAPLISRDYKDHCYFVSCDTPDCPGYAEGNTMNETWDNWNCRT